MILEIEFPEATKICGKERGSFYRDSFKVQVSKEKLEARQVYHGIFGFLPQPVRLALRLRNSIMRWFGFSASSAEMSRPLEDIKAGKSAGFLVIDSVSISEVVCRASEANMDMWLSVLKLSEQEFAVSTLVNLKTGSGKAYMTCIKPFHKLVVKYSIRQALKFGRI